MSSFCKGCRKTKDNEDFGIKEDGSQYKTCTKCRNRKNKPIEIIQHCCDDEELRNTLKQLNCTIIRLNTLSYMLGMDAYSAQKLFWNIISHGNHAITETITLNNIHFITVLFNHVGFDTKNSSEENVNIIMFKMSKTEVFYATYGSDKNVLEGFMKCLKLPNKKMCDICNYKKKCLRQCGKCNNKLCIDCFKTNNNEYINSCPYCRYNILEHSKKQKRL